MESIALPLLGVEDGSGKKGWPKNEAARVAVGVVKTWFQNPVFGLIRREKVKNIIFVVQQGRDSVGIERALIGAFGLVFVLLLTFRHCSAGVNAVTGRSRNKYHDCSRRFVESYANLSITANTGQSPRHFLP